MLRWIRRRPVLAAGAGLVLAGAVAIPTYLFFVRAPGDVSNPNVEFLTPTGGPAPKAPRIESFVWPTYGLNATRTRYLPVKLRPPYRRLWGFNTGHLLEFPPIIVRGTLYLVNNSAVAYALSSRTGRPIWKRRLGRLNATSPTYAGGRLFIATLSGNVNALNARTGRILWRHPLPSRTESSPLALGQRVYIGTEDGTVYGLDARTGRTVWTYRADGPVKCALAYRNGVLYFGDYAGDVTAVRARDGHKFWSSSTQGASFNRSGTFYSTPAVAFGRVYVGNTDSKVYSFSARTGKLAWTRTTGSYVYAGPAVARVPGGGPTVYIGSSDGYFYAYNARSGGTRWKYRIGGRVAGAASIIGNVVYFSDVVAKKTVGVDARTGRRVFSFPRGGFNPVVSDGRRLYLTGWRKQYAFVPKRRRARPPQLPRRTIY